MHRPLAVFRNTARSQATSCVLLLLRASARRRLSSCHPTCRRQASAPAHVAALVALAGAAAAVMQARQQVDVVRLASRPVRVRVSHVAVRPVRAEPPAEARPEAAVRFVQVPAARQVARAAPPCHAGRPFRVAPAAAQWVPVERWAVKRTESGLLVSALPAVASRVLCAVPPCCVDQTCRVARAAAQWMPVGRLAVQRPRSAPQVAVLPVVGAARPCRVAPAPVLEVPTARLSLGQPLASVRAVRRK